PTSYPFLMTLEPPAIEHAQARHPVERCFHTTGPRGFLRSLRGIEPEVHASADIAGQRHIVIFQIDHLHRFSHLSRSSKNTPDQRLTRRILGMGLATIDDLQ